MQGAERDLARARLAADGDPAVGPAFAAAITGLRQHSTPYHLAHGLLEHAAHLSHLGDDQAAAATASEAVGIARQLRCQPLLDRAETSSPPRPAPRPPDNGICQSRPPAAANQAADPALIMTVPARRRAPSQRSDCRP